MIFFCFLSHPLLSFAKFSSAYFSFYISEDSNLMHFSLLLLFLYVIRPSEYISSIAVLSVILPTAHTVLLPSENDETRQSNNYLYCSRKKKKSAIITSSTNFIWCVHWKDFKLQFPSECSLNFPSFSQYWRRNCQRKTTLSPYYHNPPFYCNIFHMWCSIKMLTSCKELQILVSVFGGSNCTPFQNEICMLIIRFTRQSWVVYRIICQERSKWLE